MLQRISEDEKGIMTDFRKQWNDTCKAAGLKPITLDTAARIMAVVFCFKKCKKK